MITFELHRGTIQTYRWLLLNADRHRINAPAVITYHSNGNKRVVAYYLDDELDRNYIQGPAYTYWYLNGQKHIVNYLKIGMSHRPAHLGPAYISWWPDGIKMEEQYMEEGTLHRPDGPAHIRWDTNGKIYLERNV